MWYDSYFMLNMDKSMSTKKLNQMKNKRMFVMTFMRLMDAAMRRYRIEGLPPTVSERLVMESMIVFGNITFFKHNGGILALPAVPTELFNVNGDPIKAWVFSKNGLLNKEVNLYVEGSDNSGILLENSFGETIQVDEPDAIMIWERKSRFPFIEQVITSAEQISDTYRTIDVARKWIKQPFFCVAEESVIPSVKKMLKDINDNDEAIIASTGIQSIDKFNILPIATSESSIQSAVELVDWYEQKFREACAMRSNSSIDKKGENLIESELSFNDTYTDQQEEDLLDYIQKQLDVANKFLGTSMRIVEVEGAEEKQEVNENEDAKTETSGRV